MSEAFVARIVADPADCIVTSPDVVTVTAPDTRVYVTVPLPEPPVVSSCIVPL